MRSPLGFLVSILIHAGVVLSALIYFPKAAPEFQDSSIVPVDMVTLADTTNVRAAQTEPVEETEPEPEPEPEEAEPEAEDEGLNLDDLSSLVDRNRRPEERQASEQAEDARRGAGAGTAMTATMIDLFRSQAARCWREPADAPNPEELRVSVEIELDRNGELAGRPALRDAGRIRNSSNPFLQIAGERALRAVIECAPYELPADEYRTWRRITVNFDPSSM